MHPRPPLAADNRSSSLLPRCCVDPMPDVAVVTPRTEVGATRTDTEMLYCYQNSWRSRDTGRRAGPGRTPVRAVASRIARLIESGTLRPGDRVPSLREISRPAASVAVDEPAGVRRAREPRAVEARPQSGFYVRPRPMAQPPEPKGVERALGHHPGRPGVGARDADAREPRSRAGGARGGGAFAVAAAGAQARPRDRPDPAPQPRPRRLQPGARACPSCGARSRAAPSTGAPCCRRTRSSRPAAEPRRCTSRCVPSRDPATP